MTIKELLIKHEGKKSRPYKCPAGFNTIGIGYNFDANPLPEDIEKYLKENGKITEDMIDRLLFLSVGAATTDCHSLFPDFDNFTEARRMALVDFLFNIGKRRAMGFRKAIAAINTKRWADAAKEMKDSTWFNQVKGRAAEIIEMIEEG